MSVTQRSIAAALLLSLLPAVARAQHDMGNMAGMPGMEMPMTGALGISMERLGSGTTWIPDAVRLPSAHFTLGKWSAMLHGFAFAQFDKQAKPRGKSQFGSLNWAMLMADRPLAGGHLQFRFMPSLDALTVGTCGYPLLLQTGETCNGVAQVDRQHPHDFFMELAALYEREITPRVGMLLYAAPAGEPALGPVAFMHRPSAMDNPAAPLGHHWQDATHISFGVATAGVFTKTLRLEASAFNGHEPDENRWDIDPVELNSYSARVTLNPGEHWSFTAGYGSIAEHVSGQADAQFHRVVGSMMHGRKLGDRGQVTTTVIVGANKAGGWTSSVLAESEALLDVKRTVFARLERAQRSAADLIAGSVGPAATKEFAVYAATLGGVRELDTFAGATLGIGASGTVNFVPSALQKAYGSLTPMGAMVFVRLRAR